MRIITIDRDLAEVEDVARYLMLHEAIHLKPNTSYRADEFYRLLYGIMPEEEVKNAMQKALSN